MFTLLFIGPQLAAGGEENLSIPRGLGLTFSQMKVEELVQAVLEVGAMWDAAENARSSVNGRLSKCGACISSASWEPAGNIYRVGEFGVCSV